MSDRVPSDAAETPVFRKFVVTTSKPLLPSDIALALAEQGVLDPAVDVIHVAGVAGDSFVIEPTHVVRNPLVNNAAPNWPTCTHGYLAGGCPLCRAGR